MFASRRLVAIVAIVAVLVGMNQIMTTMAFPFQTITTTPHSRVTPFQSNINDDSERSTVFILRAAGGFGGTAFSKRNNKSKNKKASTNKKLPSTVSFDANASLLRLEKKYEELSQADAKRLAKQDHDVDIYDDIVSTEYIVAVRPSSQSSSSFSSSVSDWVPVAQLMLCRKDHFVSNNDDDSKHLLYSAVSFYCRELAQAALLGSRMFAVVPRNYLQYSVESTSSFYKHVYDNILVDSVDSDNESMTNANARSLLGLVEDDKGNNSSLDRSTLKKAYRNLSMEWHPDRMIGESKEKQREAATRYANIKQAYETLLAGGTVQLDSQAKTMPSWYESLGGRERTDFWVLDKPLLPIAKAQSALDMERVESAVTGLDPDLVQSFVARNSRSQRQQ